MDFVISRDEGIVSVDNQPLAVATSSVPANVAMVAFDCSGGAGNVEYNDRLRLLEPFIDVTPYLALINAWLSAAAMMGMPITLAQAKMVKIGLVDGIFNSERQLPIDTQNYTWDASDPSFLGMQAAVMAWDVAGAITQADATFAANVNGMTVQTPHTGVAANAIAGVYSSIANYFSASWPYSGTRPPLGGSWGPSTNYVYSVYGGDVTQQPNVGMQKSPINAPSASVLAGPPIDWPPINSTVLVRLSMASMRAIIWAIQWRRTQLQTTRLFKESAINALTTIADVIAYDVSSGWGTTVAPAPPGGIITGGGISGIVGGGPSGGPIVVTRAGPWVSGGFSTWAGFTFAVAIDASALTMLDGGAKTRLVLKGFNFNFDKCYIGPRVPQLVGQTPDKIYTPNPDPGGLVQVTFNGNPGGHIAAISGNSGFLISDDLPQGIDGTNGIVVYFLGSASGGSADYSDGNSFGFDCWYTFGDFILNPNRRPGGSPYTHYRLCSVILYQVQGVYPAAGWYPRLPPMKFYQAGGGWGGYTVIVSIDPSVISPTRSGDKTKIALLGYGPLTFDKCYIGPRSTSHPFGMEMASSTQLFFNNGNAGASIGAGQTLFSDELPQGTDGSNGLVIRCHITAGGLYETSGTPGFTSYYSAGDYAVQSTGGPGWNVVPNLMYLASQILGSYPAAS
jgi:hypothetical protein